MGGFAQCARCKFMLSTEDFSPEELRMGGVLNALCLRCAKKTKRHQSPRKKLFAEAEPAKERGRNEILRFNGVDVEGESSDAFRDRLSNTMTDEITLTFERQDSALLLLRQLTDRIGGASRETSSRDDYYTPERRHQHSRHQSPVVRSRTPLRSPRTKVYSTTQRPSERFLSGKELRRQVKSSGYGR